MKSSTVSQEHCIERDLRHLKDVRKTVVTFCQNVGIPLKETSMIEISIDEIMANVIEHSDGTGDIRYQLTFHSGCFECRIFDKDNQFENNFVDRFRIEEYIGERKERGLGLHIVNQFVDEFHVTHSDGCCVYGIIKNIKAG